MLRKTFKIDRGGYDGPFEVRLAVGAITVAFARWRRQQIGLFVVADGVGIYTGQAGQFAKDRAFNDDVKDFAADMADEHGTARERQTALFTRSGIVPLENATSQELRKDNEQLLASLQGLAGNVFDRTYMDGQVKAHNKVLTLLDTQILPTVLNSELRDEFTGMRADVAEHLMRAQELLLQIPLSKTTR